MNSFSEEGFELVEHSTGQIGINFMVITPPSERISAEAG